MKKRFFFLILLLPLHIFPKDEILEAFLQSKLKLKQLKYYKDKGKCKNNILEKLLKGEFNNIKITPFDVLNNGKCLLSHVIEQKNEQVLLGCIKYDLQKVVEYIRQHHKEEFNGFNNLYGNITTKIHYNLAINKPVTCDELIRYATKKFNRYIKKQIKRSELDNNKHFNKILRTIDLILSQKKFFKISFDDSKKITAFFKEFKILQYIDPTKFSLLRDLLTVHGIVDPEELSKKTTEYKDYFILQREQKIIKPRLDWLLKHQDKLYREDFIEKSPILNFENQKDLNKAKIILLNGVQKSLRCCLSDVGFMIKDINNINTQWRRQKTLEEKLNHETMCLEDYLFEAIDLSVDKEVYDVHNNQYKTSFLDYLKKKNKENLLELALATHENLVNHVSKYGEIPFDPFDFSNFEEFCKICKEILNILISNLAIEFFNRLSEWDQAAYLEQEKTVRKLIVILLQNDNITLNFLPLQQMLEVLTEAKPTAEVIQKIIQQKIFDNNNLASSQALIGSRLYLLDDTEDDNERLQTLVLNMSNAADFHEKQITQRYGTTITEDLIKYQNLTVRKSDLLPDEALPEDNKAKKLTSLVQYLIKNNIGKTVEEILQLALAYNDLPLDRVIANYASLKKAIAGKNSRMKRYHNKQVEQRYRNKIRLNFSHRNQNLSSRESDLLPDTKPEYEKEYYLYRPVIEDFQTKAINFH